MIVQLKEDISEIQKDSLKSGNQSNRLQNH
jgi:hypothetical protein